MHPPKHLCFAALLLLVPAFVSSCSESTSEAGKAKDPESKPEFPFGGKVDSMNGIAGHTFGQPISAFSDMKPLPKQPGDVMDTYSYQGTKGWFGKNRGEVPNQWYDFVDGKFYRFRAIGDAATLSKEVVFLLGPGMSESPNTFWTGQRARAIYTEKTEAFGRTGTLVVLSKPVEEELEVQEKARMTAENAE